MGISPCAAASATALPSGAVANRPAGAVLAFIAQFGRRPPVNEPEIEDHADAYARFWATTPPLW